MSSHRDREHVDFVDLARLGYLLILIGALLLLRPDLPGLVEDFFRDFQLQPAWGGSVTIPVPMSNHPALYGVAFDFCVYMLAFEFVGLLFRFILDDPPHKKAGAASGLVFWGGFAWIIYLLRMQLISWPMFLGWFIVVAGTSIAVHAIMAIFLHSIRFP